MEEKMKFECHEVAKVMSTNCYEAFTMLDGNRAILEERVEKIKKSFQKKVIRNPIVVNEKLEIIDGQGRFTVLKEMERPIEYIVVPNIGLEECRLMNIAQSNWKQEDYINLYIKKGNDNYALLKEVMDKTGYRADNILRTLHRAKGKGKGELTSSIIANGTLRFTKEDKEVALEKIDLINEISEILGANPKLNAFFNAAVVVIDYEEYDHKSMIKNCQLRRTKFQQASDLAGNITELGNIYNYRRKNTIDFEKYMKNKGRNVRNYYK